MPLPPWNGRLYAHSLVGALVMWMPRRLDAEGGEFVDGGMELHQYLEDHLAKHLKVQLDLDPTGGLGGDKTYGPDPT